MALNFRLFNCDRTFSLDKVEALIQRVAAKISRETKIEKTYFPLPRMDELCGELEKEGSHFEYAVFVVHAHESRLSINEANAGIGYAKVYRALQKATGDRVLIVIGGDDNYKNQEERDKSVLSRWAWRKICSQFTEDYVNGVKSFIFSWEENHHPLHEEALEFYLDPTKKETQFVPRPKPPPAKVPEKEEFKSIQKSKLSVLKKQEPMPMDTKSILEPQCVPMKTHFYRASISNGSVVKVLESDPPGWEPRYLNEMLEKHGYEKKAIIEILDEGDGRLQCSVHRNEAKLSKIAEGFATNKMHSILVYSYHVEEETNETLSKFIHHVGARVLLPWDPIEPLSLITEITCVKPDYVMFSADIDVLKDELEVKEFIREHGAKITGAIESFVGKGVIIMLFGDKSYKEGEFASKEATQYARMLTQDIVSADRLTVMTCNKKLYTTHQDWMKRSLNSKSAAQSASQGAVASVPSQQYCYQAVIKSGQIVEVLKQIPAYWKPDEQIVRKQLEKHRNENKAYLEILGNDRGEILSITVEKESKGPSYYANKVRNTVSSLFVGDTKDKHSDKKDYV